MRFIALIVLAALIYGVLRTHFSLRRARGAQERSAIIRFEAFSWMFWMLTVALLFLPVPGLLRMLFLVPVFFVGASVSKILQGARDRIRREEQGEVDIERMKRIN